MSKKPDTNQLAHLSHLATTGDQETLGRLLAEANFDRVHLSEALLKAAEHCSITSGHLPCIDLLLTAGASLHSLPDGSSFLMKACLQGQIQLVELALDRGGRVRETDSSSKTPLHYAVDTDRGDNGDVVELLLERGADPNACDREGRSPLHYAAQRGAHLSLKVLLEHNALIGLQDNSRQTALNLAIAHSHLKCVECFRARPASTQIDEEKPTYQNIQRGDMQILLMSPGPDIGEELETKSGSSLSSGRHTVCEVATTTESELDSMVGRLRREIEGKRRELAEETIEEQLAEGEMDVLEREKQWLVKEAERERVVLETQVKQLEQVRNSLPTLETHRPILSFQKLPLFFNEAQTLLHLQSDLNSLLTEIDNWQSLQASVISRAVDHWRSFTSRIFTGTQTKVYGSVATQLYLPGFSVDLVIIHSPVGCLRTLRVLEERCKRENGVESALLDSSQYLPVLHVTLLINHTSVPLRVTVMDGRHRGLKCTQVVRSLLDSMPHLRSVYLFLKHLFHSCGASDPQRGGLGSYALFLMTAAEMRAEPGGTPEEHVLRWLTYYGFECPYLAPISALGSPQPFDPPYQSLYVQDPIAPQSNLASMTDLLFLLVLPT